MPILLVKVNTRQGPDNQYTWKAGQVIGVYADDHEFGADELVSAGYFYHIAITDKTLEECQQYMQGWKHNPTIQQVSNQGNRRLIEVTSDMVSATGKNAFTQEGVLGLMEELNELYPTADAAYDSHTQNSFRFQVTVPISGRDELIQRIEKAVKQMQYAQRRWYITAAGMTYLGNNGGAVSGTAAQVAGYLRDGLLD